jgi:hypothetical protein
MATDLAERAEVRRRALEAAVGGDVITTTPCIFHSRFSVQNKQGGVRMTLYRRRPCLEVQRLKSF